MTRFDVSAAEFEGAVIDRSYTVPVLVDFWAPWCAPCRLLGPVLEQLADEAAGAWELAKLDSDQAPELSQRFGVRGIPFVLLFVDGKPVGNFVGAQPEASVRQFLARHLPGPGRTVLADARAAFDAGELGRAGELAGSINEGADEWEAARHIVAAVTWIETARAAGDRAALAARLARDEADLDARFALAGHAVAERRMRDALDDLVAVLERGRKWNDEAGRKAMLTVFGLVGPQDPLAAEYRRKLMVLT